MIAIVDYGMGNLRSVQKAFESVGAQARITQDAADIRAAEKVVVPGVGAFKVAMERLTQLKLVDVLRDVITGGKPYLGICLGLQLLFEESEEFGRIRGLGVFRGKVVRFSGVKVPHMGWNQITKTAEDQSAKAFDGIPDNSFMYFCHSYFIEPQDTSITALTTDYGRKFASAVSKGAITGVQFHPEKSQALGLQIIRNFVRS